MANKIAKIKPLDDLLEKRYADIDGERIEIGHFWSVLQIYECMITLNISIKTICEVASKMNGRLDSKYRKDDKPISQVMLRNYLHLCGSPSQISHTVVTKTVAKGVDSAKDLEALTKVLQKHNSYGPDLAKDIIQTLDKSKGNLKSTKFSVMGNSGFAQVLKLCLALTELYKSGIISDMSSINATEHVSHIIKIITENKTNVKNIDTLGFW